MMLNKLSLSPLFIIGLLVTMLAACNPQQVRNDSSAPAETADSSLFESLECIHCHQMDGNGPGPSLVGLYGQTVPLENGETITVDEQYIRTSILEPRMHTHAGYPPIMPSYAQRVSEAELEILVAFIQSLKEGN